MKRLGLLTILLFCFVHLFAQNQDSVIVIERENSIDSIQVIPAPQTALPSILQQQAATKRPTVTSVVSEIPNDTTKPTVNIKVITTEDLMKDQIYNAETAVYEEKKTANDTRKFESFADAEDTIKILGRTYKIQVLALQNESKGQIDYIKKKVADKVPVTVEDNEGMKKYMVGVFDTYYDAVKYRDSLVKKGFKGAFVVVYFRDNRVSRQEGGFKKIKKE